MNSNIFPIINLAAIAAVLVLVIALLRKTGRVAAVPAEVAPVITKLGVLCQLQEQIDRTVREEFSRSRQETSGSGQALRSEILAGLSTVQSGMEQRFATFQGSLDERQTSLQVMLRDSAKQLRDETGASFKNFEDRVVQTLAEMVRRQQTELIELRTAVDGRLATIQIENEKKLEQMRQTVDEKLQGTLEARLGESFKQVSDRLEQVHKGLGEVQSLAAGVGDLKRVLTNVKARGMWGEVQLGALLEQILAPGQYSRNVATTGTLERVEFAIRLPGHEGSDAPIWLPIDAKFPIEDYQRLVDAAERGDAEAADKATRQLEATLRNCARNISQKYIAPPATTDFGILFLRTEGLYAEAMRRPGLAESIQREYRVALTGPSTLAALLNSFQMGFRTLAIQERSSEVWGILGTVKSEFGKYADVLGKVKKKLTEAQNTIDKAETRTRAIHRSLRDVEGPGSNFVLLDEVGADTASPDEQSHMEAAVA